MKRTINVGGLDLLQNLITDLAKTPSGSAALDMRIARLIYPKENIVDIDGEPVIWGRRDQAKELWMPVPQFSRSTEAAFQWEKIVRVEKLSEGQTTFWRARQYPIIDGDGLTEATARRVAALTDWITDKLAGPDPNFPRTSLPEGVMRPTVLPKGFGYRRPSTDRLGRFTMQPFQEETDNELIIQILLDHIRELRGQLADQPTEVITIDHPSTPSRGTFVPGRNVMKRLKAVEQSVISQNGPSNQLLSEVAKSWLLENKPRIKNKERMLRSLRRFIEFHGDRPIDGYSKSELREFLNALWDVPKFIPNEMKKLPLPTILEYFRKRPEVQRITVTTVRSYQKDLQAIFNWAHYRDMCAANPAAGLLFIDKRLQSEKRLPFDEHDLRRIFMESPMYSGCRSSTKRLEPGDFLFRDSLYWFGLVALFTGARLNELGKSAVDDYRQQDGIDFLDIHTRRDDPHLKSLSADRQIPLHPMLKKLGFLQWVEDRRRKGKEFVFGEMFGRKDLPVKGWSHSWMQYQRGIGLTDPRKVFHSFRHTFKGACRSARIEEEVHDALTGHRPFFSGRGYGGPVPLNIKFEAIVKVRYPNLDLSHLYAAEKLSSKKVIDEWTNQKRARRRPSSR